MAAQQAGAQASSLIDKGVDALFANSASKSQEKAQSRLMDKQAHLTRQLRSTAARDMVYGLKQAGLNPILAAGETGATGSVGLGSAVAPQTHASNSAERAERIASIENIKENTKLNAAQKEEVKEKTRELKLANDQNESRGTTKESTQGQRIVGQVKEAVTSAAKQLEEDHKKYKEFERNRIKNRPKEEKEKWEKLRKYTNN